MKILRGVGAPKIFGPPKGGSVNIVGLRGGLRKFVYFKSNRKGGGLRRQAAFSFAVLWIIVCNCKKLNRYRGVLLKFQALSFNIFIPPSACHIKWTFPKEKKIDKLFTVPKCDLFLCSFLYLNRSPSLQLRLVLFGSFWFLCLKLLDSSFQSWR